MSNISKKSPCFQKVIGVQDISHENAAACSGGTIILYDNNNFTGNTYVRGTGSWSNLGSFDNRASSVLATAGTWELWSGINFTGNKLTVSSASGGIVLNSLLNNQVSSIRRTV